MENHECFSISEASEIKHVGVEIKLWYCAAPHFLPLITESRARCVYVIWRWAMQAHFLAALKLIKFPSNAQVDSSTDSGTSPPVT